MEKIRKTTARFDCPIVTSEEFTAVDDDNECTDPIMADKDILEFIQSSKGIIDADYDDEKEINNAVPVPTSSGMKNTMKNIFSYLDAHFNCEINYIMADIVQYVDNLMLEKAMARKISDYFLKTQ
ncbi:hypothetical protein TNCV_2381821 [Trichonephila clavipes]|nr:hypothetical protein TNCV_2381821 [Trichonephila clavipes]